MVKSKPKDWLIDWLIEGVIGGTESYGWKQA